ncbi:MAG TPA: hypothetical protein VF904_12095 [Anaeromyxobacteraceae bacterium]
MTASLSAAAAAVAAMLALAGVDEQSAPWRVEVTTYGGLSGRGAGAVKVRSGGEIEVVTLSGQRCERRLETTALAKLEEALRRARPARWRSRYFMPDNPTGCCDQVSTTLALIRGTGPAEKRFVTGWFDESRRLVPHDALALQEAAMDLALQDQGCAGKRR